MKDLIIAIILIAVIGCAVLYIYKAKKNGTKCIGCPNGSSCDKNNSCSFKDNK